MMKIYTFVVNPILKFVYSIFKNTPLYKNLLQWTAKIRTHNRLHTSEWINKEVSSFTFNNIGKSKQLNGINLSIWYEKDMRKMTIIDSNRNKRTIRIPYLEIINFCKNPNTRITISCSEDDPLFLNNKFSLPESIRSATEVCIEEAKKNSPQTTNDPHPRLAALRRINKDDYQCVLEETRYYTQISSNLSMDFPICIDGHRRTTMRTLEMEQHKKEMKEWKNLNVYYDALHPRCLTSLDNSLLANVIGVSAIWCMGNLDNPKFYLMPRNDKVGVYKNKLGMPSGDIESPQRQNHRFRDESLIEYLKWEMAREFAEETGIRDKNRDLIDYSIYVNPDKIQYETELEIIPLALTREILRGGKPQMFFLIKTEDIPERILEKCFLASLGKKEFNNVKITTATISAEAACNYLYALEYLQGNLDGVIDLSI